MSQRTDLKTVLFWQNVLIVYKIQLIRCDSPNDRKLIKTSKGSSLEHQKIIKIVWVILAYAEAAARYPKHRFIQN
jgi:hypothetical protein